MKYLLGIALLFNTCIAFSQNLTGTWEGSASGAPIFRLIIIQIGDSCFGYSYDEGIGFCKANFAGHFNISSKKLKGKGLNFIEKTFGHSLALYNLNYSSKGNMEFLKGTVSAKTVGAKLLTFGLPFPATLYKTRNSVDTTAFMALKINAYNAPQAVETNNAKIINEDSILTVLHVDSGIIKKENRISKLVKTIYTNQDSVKLIIYDDGEIDGDIVTVFDNNKIVANKLLLTSKAVEINLAFNSSDSLHVIELVAENLGSIPPNTAYMLIVAGGQRYEVKASSDLTSNAKIIIQYKQ
ncbi:MAG: hypothetical protein H0W75_10550 [Chitinophagaceae bacterium]|nr:hypothetical protein [Chitinophagaceae bacterium]